MGGGVCIVLAFSVMFRLLSLLCMDSRWMDLVLRITVLDVAWYLEVS